jgi:hypothetical protein
MYELLTVYPIIYYSHKPQYVKPMLSQSAENYAFRPLFPSSNRNVDASSSSPFQERSSATQKELVAVH